MPVSDAAVVTCRQPSHTSRRGLELNGPLLCADRHDAPGLIDDLVPCLAVETDPAHVQVKRYCYALRPVLMLRWLSKDNGLPRMDVASLRGRREAARVRFIQII
ncbi:DNA polymerase beta superfamily protein [Asticcacaulis sp. 201]|uniref:DNA polymerase beta superfamily protein n=1 Tax=Asticcacaulis sp. 201 TaxID=3028787 RepID=UPI003983A8CA